MLYSLHLTNWGLDTVRMKWYIKLSYFLHLTNWGFDTFLNAFYFKYNIGYSCTLPIGVSIPAQKRNRIHPFYWMNAVFCMRF